MTEKVSLDAYLLYLMGKLMQELQDELTKGTAYWNSVRGHLETLSKVCGILNLEFLREAVDYILKEFREKYWKENSYLDYQDREGLKSSINTWEGRLQETIKHWILSYPETHINASKLTEGTKAFLSDDEFSGLEPLERQSLDEAASSLLFNNFISAEFVALRTAESLLKRWYEKKTNKKLGRTTWGEVLEKMNEEFPKEKRSKELLLLDYLRERRNEIAHPEGTSGSEEASTTFFNVISLCKSLRLK